MRANRMSRILIVDDNADEAEILSKYLAHSGHSVATAPNGREALNQVLSREPDVVLLDLVMPEMDGPSFLEVVRSYLRLQSLPVVVLTAFSESPLLQRAQALHVNSILLKGKATTEEIQAALERAARKGPD